MAKRVSKIVGEGVTKHKQETLVFSGAGDADDAKQFSKAMRQIAKWQKPWAWLEYERKVAENTLKAIERGEGDDRVFEPHYGSGWYSREILERIKIVDDARRVNDIEAACRASAQMMRLSTTIQLHVAHSADTKTGVKIHDSLASRRNAANEERSLLAEQAHREWQAEADSIWAKYPRRSKSDVAGIVKTRLKLTCKVDTIRKAIKK